MAHEAGNADLAAQLGDHTSGSDLTSLLLDVADRQASRRSASDVLRQYERDRFTRPAAVAPATLLSTTATVAGSVGTNFDFVELAPLVPLGTHSVIAGGAQNRVGSPVRATEVAADPTTALAWEAAVRRRAQLREDPRSIATVRLAAANRVVRAQAFDGPRSYAHFMLLGMVSAGRDVGSGTFERTELVRHIGALLAACRACKLRRFEVRVTDLDGSRPEAIEHVRAELAGDGVGVTEWPERQGGRGYYDSLCFKIDVLHDGEWVEVADGGDTAWTQRLLGNRKERLVISGLGLERLASLATAPRP